MNDVVGIYRNVGKEEAFVAALVHIYILYLQVNLMFNDLLIREFVA